MSLYLSFWSDLFSDDQLSGLVTMRSSTLSIVVLGVSALLSTHVLVLPITTGKKRDCAIKMGD